MVSEGSWFWLPHGMVSSILYYCYYALCYGYEQVVLYCDCYAQTCFLSFSQCSLSSGIVLLCISICSYAIHVHCTVCFPLHLSGYFIIVLDSLYHYGTFVFCSLISHMGMHDIRTECVESNVARQCLFCNILVKYKQFNVLQPWLEKHLLPSWPWPCKRSIRLN